MPELDLGLVVGEQGAPGAPGADATINGFPAITIMAGKNMDIDQSTPGTLVLNATLEGSDDAIPAEEKGAPGGVATLDEMGKVPTDQLPKMDYVLASEKGVADGIATLDSTGKVPKSQLPEISSAAGKRTCRFAVGTSTAGWTAADCDYLCDGTDDQAEINAAIQALPEGGGEIVILNGIYNITATISVNRDNVKLSGNGNATVLKRFWDSSEDEGVITLKSQNGGCLVSDLMVDGNMSDYDGFRNCGIYLDASSNNAITSNVVSNNISNGICIEGSSFNAIIGNVCNNNGTGINFNVGSGNNTATGNICSNNHPSCGIYLFISSENNITGNICNSNHSDGIAVTTGSNNNTITGNTCNNNNSRGIQISASNSTVAGNTCIRGAGASSDYTESQHTINAVGSNNLIVGNNIMGKNYTDSGTGNTWENNKYN